MATVDPDDDGITRYVVRHYRYDPERNERRHVVIAAYDNQAEFEQTLGDVSAQLKAAKAAGEAEAQEHITGEVLQPHHRARVQAGRLVHRAIVRGVAPSTSALRNLPENTAVAGFRRAEDPQ